MNVQANVLPDLTADIAAANRRIAELEARLALASKPRKATLKITDKGGLSLYGLGRFPVTLYRGQWERLLSMAGEIREFIEANGDRLSTKE
jgi:hypothetical protein